MLEVHVMQLGNRPQLSICTGVSPEREYLWRRCWADMECELRGLPVEFLAGYLRDETWNESACKNAAAKCAAANALLFTNCDIVIGRGVAEEAMYVAENQMLVCLRKDEQPDGSWVDNEHAIGDCQVVQKSLWLKAGGFDERLTGWGFIDYSFLNRVKQFAECFGGDNRVRHHWHPRLTDEEYRRQNQRNREISET